MSPTDNAPLTGRHVLIVEDEYFLAHTMQDAFRQVGAYVLGPVPSVDDALELIAEADVLDAAVLDLNLQGEMAYPVADALHARNVPFVFVTGYDRSAIDKSYSWVTRCEKPVDPMQVAGLLICDRS